MIVVLFSMLVFFFCLTIKYILIIVTHMRTIKGTCIDMYIPQSTCIEPCSRAVAFFHTLFICLLHIYISNSKPGPVTAIIALFCGFPFSVCVFFLHSSKVLEKVSVRFWDHLVLYLHYRVQKFRGTLQTVER